jgi:hypothetical protein
VHHGGKGDLVVGTEEGVRGVRGVRGVEGGGAYCLRFGVWGLERGVEGRPCVRKKEEGGSRVEGRPCVRKKEEGGSRVEGRPCVRKR